MQAMPITGRGVLLEPLEESHREGLRPAAQDERIWQYTLSSGFGEGFDRWFNEALASRAQGTRLPFAVRLRRDGQVVGSTSYLDIHPQHKRIEIGSTWYHPKVWATPVNPECKLLLLTHAFEDLGVNRVALVTDGRNERSQAAIAKLGAVREGVLRAHCITQTGYVRDTVVFSIVSAQWPAVKAKLEGRLAEPTIRTQLRPGDVGNVVRMHGEIHGTECGFDPTFEAYVAGPLAEFVKRGDGRERIWLAESGGRIVGSIAIVVGVADVAQLRWFLVEPAMRGRGLGTRLINESLAFCRECGYASVILWTVSSLEAAARLYLAAGFVKAEEKPGRMWGVEVVEEKYELRLR